MTHRVYFLRNTNESDNPDAAENAVLEVRTMTADYRSSTADGRNLVVQNRLDRSTAALYLRRARERGWAITRWTA